MHVKTNDKEKITLTLDLNSIKFSEDITLDDFVELLKTQRFEFLRFDAETNLLYVTTSLTKIDKLRLVLLKFKTRLIIELDSLIYKIKRKAFIFYGQMTVGLKRKIKRNITKEKVKGFLSKCKGKFMGLFKKKEE